MSEDRMVIYVKTGISRGKAAAAAVHAALTAMGAHHGGPVIVLGASRSDIEQCSTVIRDAGRTEVEPGTVTAGTNGVGAAMSGDLREKVARALYQHSRTDEYADPEYDWENIDRAYDPVDTEEAADPEWLRNSYRAEADALLPIIEQHFAGPPEGWTEQVEHRYPSSTHSHLVTGQPPSHRRQVWTGPWGICGELDPDAW